MKCIPMTFSLPADIVVQLSKRVAAEDEGLSTIVRRALRVELGGPARPIDDEINARRTHEITEADDILRHVVAELPKRGCEDLEREVRAARGKLGEWRAEGE